MTRDARRDAGFFPVWRKDDRVWLELTPERFGQRFLFTVDVTHGIGEGEFFGGRMGGYGPTRRIYIVSLRRFGTNGVQLIAHNPENVAHRDSAARFMVERSFSESLLGQTSVVTQPHADSKAVLIDANSLLVNDFASGAGELDRMFRARFNFDGRNSLLSPVRNSPNETGLRLRAHYYSARAGSGGSSPGPSGGPPARAPQTLPDARSLFVGYLYSMARLPAPMLTRRADPRVGYFTESVSDFTQPATRLPPVRYITRWRLEKADPNAAISAPKAPISFWLDRNIPAAYRAAVTAGVLEWNKAFERIGYRNAIVARQQGDDGAIDTASLRFASIRWITSRGIGFSGRGPSKRDPRTGEILDSDIAISDASFRNHHFNVRDNPTRPLGDPGRAGHAEHAEQPGHGGHAHGADGDEHCDFGEQLHRESDAALELLEARGEIVWDSPEAQRWVLDRVKVLVMHEVGHALGLRHNFRASTYASAANLSDPEWTARNAMGASVMDYYSPNVAAQGERQAHHWGQTLGVYDYWAIEYGYKPFAAAEEAQGLKAILERSTEPGMAYGEDVDAGRSGVEGLDPLINTFDMTDDPLAYARKNVTLARELWRRLQSADGEGRGSYSQHRRGVDRGFAMLARGAQIATRYVGGVHQTRQPSGSGLALRPVPASQQRQALQMLTSQVFEVGAFRFTPQFLARLAPDWATRDDPDADSSRLDESITEKVFVLQRATLQQLMRPATLNRVMTAHERNPKGEPVMGLAELYTRIQEAVWRDLSGAGPIELMRRNLQRLHVDQLVQAITSPVPGTPPDARSLQREMGQRLLVQLRAASARRSAQGAMLETRAHLNHAVAVLDAALKAQIAITVSR